MWLLLLAFKNSLLFILPFSPSLLQVGVHIADVSYYVSQDSPLDLEAQERATTVYLTTRNIPMLPRQLCENLCSLVPGVDRLTFSVMFRVDKEGEVIGQPWYGRTVIRSCVKLAYGMAQMFLDGVEPEEVGKGGKGGEEGLPELWEGGGKFGWGGVRDCVKKLGGIAKHLRRKRLEVGTLVLNNLKIYFQIDPETGGPVGVGSCVLREANYLVEEFMLMANRWVARKLVSGFRRGSLLRAHQSPQDRKFKQCAKWCERVGIHVVGMGKGETGGRSVKALQGTLDKYENDFVALCCLRSNMTKPMVLAKYVPTMGEGEGGEGKGEGGMGGVYHHYGLGFDLYTHFTSPIRRYADLIVHRLLQATLEKEERERKGEEPQGDNGGNPYNEDEMKKIAENCNGRKWNADKAQENSDRIFLCKYLKTLPGQVLRCPAIISEIFANGAEVIVPELALETKVYFDAFSNKQKPRNGTVVEMEFKGEKVEVRSLDVVEVAVGVGSGKNPLFPEVKCTLLVDSVVKLGKGKEGEWRRTEEGRRQVGRELEERVFGEGGRKGKKGKSSERDPSLRM